MRLIVFKIFTKVSLCNVIWKLKGKLQITLLKFGSNWILHFEVLEFGFYPLIFGGVWILHPDVLEFGGVKSEHSLTFGGKIQILKLQGVKSKHLQTLGSKSKHP